MALSEKRPISVDDFLNVKRIDNVALSPNGEWLAFDVTVMDSVSDVFSSDIYLANTRGTSIRHLTTNPAYDGKPGWSPDGSLLAFLSDRNGTRQIHVIPISGGEAVRVSDIQGGIEDFVWSPAGRFFAFTAFVDKAKNSETMRLQTGSDKSDPPDDRMDDHACRALFLMPDSGGKPIRLSPDTLSIPKGHGMFAFSPDGRQIVFSAALSAKHPPALFMINRTGERLRRMTMQLSTEDEPAYSPDGRLIAFRSTMGPGPGQTDLVVYSRKDRVVSNMTGFFDLDVHEITWSHDSERLYFTVPDQGREVLFSVEVRSRKIRGLVYTGYLGGCQVSPGQDRLYFKRTRAHQPDELFSSDENGEDVSQLTFINPSSSLAMNPLEEFWFPSFDGKMVHGFILKPPGFNASQKYPLILSIHDGPHDASRDAFDFRWNPQLLASRGAVILAINYRGSRGFGQEFNEASQKDWGGAPYKDLMAGLEYAIGKFSFIDSERMAACGEFYGGFLTHWIAGHTDRFKCLIAQSGIADPYSLYFETDDPAWLEWEMGAAPFDDEKTYEKWTPLHFAKDFVTPMLIIQGGLDARNPQGGLKIQSAYRRLGTPSRLLFFEDEGLSIERPSHIRLFWQTVLEWMDQWIGEQIQP